MPRAKRASPFRTSAVGRLRYVKKGKKITTAHLTKASAVRHAKAGKMQCAIKAVRGVCPASHPHKGKSGIVKGCCFGHPLTKGRKTGHRAHAGLKALKICLPKVDKRGITHEQVLTSYPLKGGRVAQRCVKAGSRAARKFAAKRVSGAGEHAGILHLACASGKVAIQKTKVMPPRGMAKGTCCKNGAGPRTSKEAAARRRRCGPPAGEAGHDSSRFVTCPSKTYVSCAKPRGEHKKSRALACKVGEILASRMRKHTGGLFKGKTLKEVKCVNFMTTRANIGGKGWTKISGQSYGTRPALALTHTAAAGHKGAGARRTRKGTKAGKVIKLKSGTKRLIGKGASRGKHAGATKIHERVHAAKSKAVMPIFGAKKKKSASKKSKKPKKPAAAKKSAAKKAATKKTATKKITAAKKAVVVAVVQKATKAAKAVDAAATKTVKATKATKAKVTKPRARGAKKPTKALVSAAAAAVNTAKAGKTAAKQAVKAIQTAGKQARKAKTPQGVIAAKKRVTRATKKINSAANKVTVALRRSSRIAAMNRPSYKA